MPQIINTNIASLNAQRNLNKSQSANQTSLQRLSSGLRINSAKDDAAGLAISTRFNSQIRGLNVAVRNAGDGISLAQTAEGALGSMNDNLQRIRELAVQSANATNSDVDRDALQAEVSQLLAEVSRTADETDFNGRKLLDGSFSATFQIGANAGQTLEVSIAELTAEKLGSASTAGVTAIGSDQALSNGDLIINGVSIAASNAGDDTSSTSNAAASAIAKVEAINRQSDETGVTASVNENVVSGAEMAGAGTTGVLSLNGVDIALTTTASSSQTRAGVVEAINALSEQTGVMAVNTDSDAGGVQLIAKDGRNVQITLSGTLTAASTGLAADATTPGNAVTYEGGYTLVADAAVGKVVIDGGNGTGKGDLANAGLVKGTYDRGVASSVSAVNTSDLQATKVSDTTATGLGNKLASVNDNATLLGGDSIVRDLASNAAASAVALINDFVITTFTPAGTATSTLVAIASDTSVASAANVLNTVAGVNAFERVEFQITDFNPLSGGSTLYIANQSISLPGDISGSSFVETSARLQALVDAINSTSFSTDVNVTAELNQAKTSINVVMDNGTGISKKVGVSTGAALSASTVSGALTVVVGSAGAGNVFVGNIAFNASGTTDYVDIAAHTATAGAGGIFSGGTYTGSSYGNDGLATTGTNELSVTVDDVSLGAITVANGSTVSDTVNEINTAFGADGVNAWEDITLVFDANNLNAGDTISIGALGSAATGVSVAATDDDASGTAGVGGVDASELVDSFNNTDFSAQNIDVAASLNAAGQLVLNIRNSSGGDLGMVVSNGEGRSLQQATTGNLVGAVEQKLSGEIAYSSAKGEKVEITSAATSSGELFAGTSNSSSFAGVNGLDDGDVLINGVSIGAANVKADTASAEFASDGTKILSSSKELSAIAVAASINDVSAETGVQATINPTEVVGGDGTNNNATTLAEFEVGDAAEIYINGYSAGTVTLQDDGTGAIDTDRAKADALSVINSVAGKTGVEAIDNGVSLSMSAEDGRNISIAIDDKSGANASIGALFGMDAAKPGIGESTFGNEPADTNNGISAESATYETTYGTIRLESAGEFTIETGAEGSDELAALGLSEGKFGGAVDGQFLTEIDVSTFEGATSALTAIDNAIGAIASQRANLGAIQNRMESTVSNLAITSENLSAANSRIQDADFAAETAELSRTQVLQQAGISILAQANQGPQQVLSLLG
jgi:flagellin